MNEVILPAVLSIWTMTIKSHIGKGSEILTSNIYKYLDLNDDIVGIKTSNGERYIDEYKPNNKSKPTKQKKTFFNSSTILMKVNNMRKNPINIKLFINGSISTTGSKTLAECTMVINKLKQYIASDFGIYDKEAQEIKEITFIKDQSTIQKNSLEIGLINCGFVAVVDYIRHSYTRTDSNVIITKNNKFILKTPELMVDAFGIEYSKLVVPIFFKNMNISNEINDNKYFDIGGVWNSETDSITFPKQSVEKEGIYITSTMLYKRKDELVSIKKKTVVINHLDKNNKNKQYDVYWIIRDNLVKLLEGKSANEREIVCKFSKEDHAGVLIKYPIYIEDKKESILTIIVFASGRINIAGGAGKTSEICSKNIKEAYEFIANLLKDNDHIIRNKRNYAKLALSFK